MGRTSTLQKIEAHRAFKCFKKSQNRGKSCFFADRTLPARLQKKQRFKCHSFIARLSKFWRAIFNKTKICGCQDKKWGHASRAVYFNYFFTGKKFFYVR
ncbi:MAG: hypothetical protein WCI04_03345 [archaeon]